VSRAISSQHPVRSTFLIAAISVLLGIAISYFSAIASGPPRRESLAVAQGSVAWSSSYKYGIRFGFAGDKRKFVYPSKSKALGTVEGELHRSGHPRIRVLFSTENPSGPIYSNDKFFVVYEISDDRGSVRSYDEVRDAWRADDRVGVWLGAAFVFGGLGVLLLGIRQRQAR
jgi:hypothetical protein